MNRDLTHSSLWQRHLPVDLNASASGAGKLLQATATHLCWVAAALALVLGGAAAGLHAPRAGAWYWHLANGELIHFRGLSGTASYMATSGAALDLRSWIADLGIYYVYLKLGLGGLQLLGALGGGAVGVVLFLAARSRGKAHPLVLVLVGAVGILALAPSLTDLSSELLALLAGLLLLALAASRDRGRWGAAGLVLLVVVWTNTQADAAVAVLVIWAWIAIAHWETPSSGRLGQPSWWLLPLTGAALFLSPRGLGAITELPLSLGMSGEHPLLAAWSSIDFHPWSARLSELAGIILLGAYWLAGHRLRRADAFLGLITVSLALLWADYLPWFLVVASAQSCWYLSRVWWPQEAVEKSPAAATGGARAIAGWRLLAPIIPIVVAGALLGGTVLGVTRDGGASQQTKTQLPVQAADWLSSHPVAGTWLTTGSFGDYLSARFPDGRHLLCIDDPLPLAGAGLEECENLVVLNSGVLAMLRSSKVELAVLPRAAPEAAFLLAQGWRIRYLDSTTFVLEPRNF